MDFRVKRDALTDSQDAEQLWWEVIEPCFEELRTPYEPDARLYALTPGQRALYSLHWTRSEVDNGGFHQYLYNPTGMLADEALRGSELIAATEFAGLLRELREQVFEGMFIEDHHQRAELLDRLSVEARATLDQLTGRFYDLMGYEKGWKQSRLAECCATYVDAHRAEFFLPQPELDSPAP